MAAKGKVKDILNLVKKDGWYFVRQTGSHRHFKHATKLGVVTIPGKESDVLPTGTWISIMKQAGLK